MSAAVVAMRSVTCAARILGLGLLLGSGSLAWSQDVPAVDPTMDAIERQLEVGRHEPLLARIAQSSLDALSTDGCSGKISAGWEQIASRFPEFAANHGEEPPWQACCIAHDRAYHRGGADSGSAEQSFEQRRAADLELKAYPDSEAVNDALRDLSARRKRAR